MPAVAFKEWAAVCRALAAGRQALILRKGGIAEEGGAFRPEHAAFWLYPTHFHEQQQAGLAPEFWPLLDEAAADRPAPGRLRLTHYAAVGRVLWLDTLEAALSLRGRHVWAEETVTQRFHYRRPGLFAMAVRVYEAAEALDLPERPEYAGCKTWVELTPAPPLTATDGARPVLGDDAWEASLAALPGAP